MTFLAWAAILLLLGLALIVLEFFIPSGGLLGFLAVCCLLGSIVTAYLYDALIGFVFLSSTVIVIPLVLAAAVRWWPETPMGRRFLLTPPASQDVLPDSPRRRELQKLVGKFGRAKSKMLPSGAAEVDGRVVDALSEGQPIEVGEMVRVVAVRGTHVVVRPASEDEVATAETDSEDPLSRPIESLGLDTLEDPLS